MRTLLVAALLIAVPLVVAAPVEAQPPGPTCLHVLPCCDLPLCLDERLEPCRDPITGRYYC